MTLILSKSSSEKKPAAVWFIVEREPYGAIASSLATRAAALDYFTTRLVEAQEGGEGYTPFQRRRLSVKGPDVHVLAADDDAQPYEPGDKPDPNDPSDPLLHPDVALHTVLTADEYRDYVEHPVASALLES